MLRSYPRVRPGLPRAALGVGIGLLAGLVAACGSDSNDIKPEPTSTPSGHGHIEIGSSAPDGGSLAFEVPLGDVEVPRAPPSAA
jgi:hypothetical protein